MAQPIPVACYADVPVHSEDWHALRRGGIGSSDAADIAGLGYGSPFAKWAEKTAESWPAVDNAATRWGTRLEAVVADHFAEAHPEYQVCEPAFMYAHPERPWMRASPDRLLYPDIGGPVPVAILEIKTSRLDHAWESGPPDYVLVQVQHQLAVMDLDVCWVAVLLHGRDYREYSIQRDGELIRHLLTIEQVFWDRVQNGDPPPVDGADATTRALRELFAAEPELEVELPEEAHQWLLDAQRARALVKDCEMEAAQQENRLKLALGNATAGLLDGQVVVTWKPSIRRSVDVKALRQANPAIAEEFTVETTTRTLRFPR